MKLLIVRWAITAAKLLLIALVFFLLGVHVSQQYQCYPYAEDQASLLCYAKLWVFGFLNSLGTFIVSNTAVISAVSTVAVAAFTYTLWRSTHKLWRATKKSIGVSRKQMLLAGLSADLAQKQHGVARHQFFATHRPRLRVRLVMFNRRIQGHPIALQCEIANIGNSEATIARGEIELHVDFGAGVVGAKEMGGNRKILPGESLLAVAETDAIYDGNWKLERPMERKIRINGFVIYEDAMGVKRKTAFWRVYDHDRRGFFPEEPINTDREYED